ncbi:MAG: YwiC-like family protein [Acidimicrobiales bacterium]|nr:YwiC-like family protein [Acidimicrobiales bacterium]
MAVPSEHGGWSLTAEPVVLGLVVAWSWPGLALGLAAMLAFVARTPLKVVLVDRWRHRWLDRSRLAARIAAVELAMIGGLAAFAATGAVDRRFWIPLAVAAPLVGVELWFDMRSRSRRLIPELAGTIGIGSVVAAIVLTGGGSALLAIGLWVVVSARAAAAIPYARTQVFRAHGREVTRWHSDAAQVAAAAAVALAWGLGAIPLAPVVAVTVIAAFNVMAVRGPVKPAVVIGLQQMAFGIGVVVVTAVAVLA